MTLHEYEVATSRRVFEGRVASVRSDQVTMPEGGIAQGDPLERQYRHPVHRRRWEIPAGLLDSPRMCGELENGTTMSGLEAARVALSDGLAGLRQDDAPWRARKRPE